MVGIKSLLFTGLLAASTLAAPVEQQNEPRFLGTSKRGLAFNDASLLNTFIGKFKYGWSYNWGATGPSHGPEFVPMLWGPKMFDKWSDSVEKSLSSGATNLLGFNEPDLPEQANMSPQEAAKAWKTHMNPYSDRAKLGSPAVTNGDGDMGLNWLRSFFDACAGDCTVDFLAVHWYSSASEVEGFKSHVRDAVKLAREQGISDVWVTEFQGQGGDEEKFVEEVLPWLEGEDGVARYAYFMVDNMANTPIAAAYANGA